MSDEQLEILQAIDWMYNKISKGELTPSENEMLAQEDYDRMAENNS